MASEKIEYPKYLYHESKKPKLAKSEEEHKALGAEWKESPDLKWANPHNPKDTTVIPVDENGDPIEVSPVKHDHKPKGKGKHD